MPWLQSLLSGSGAMSESKDDNLRASRGDGERDNQEQQVKPHPAGAHRFSFISHLYRVVRGFLV
jgi:hypothetical protein